MTTSISFTNFLSGQPAAPAIQRTLTSSFTPLTPAGFEFWFSNIDGTVSKNTSVPPSAAKATFWFVPTSFGLTADFVIVWGFDAIADATLSVEFQVTRFATSRETSSGTRISTDGPTSVTILKPAQGFQMWFEILKGSITQGETLALKEGQTDIFLAVFSGQQGGTPLDCAGLVASLLKPHLPFSPSERARFQEELNACLAAGQISQSEYNQATASVSSQ